MSYSQKVLSCCVCNSLELTTVLDLGKTPLANNLYSDSKKSISQEKYNLGLLICKSCKHVQLNTEINPKLLFDNYSYKTGVSNTMRNHFIDFSEDLFKYFYNKGKDPSKVKVLDIGSNDCVFLDILQSKGFQTFGVEPAKNLAKNSSHKIFNSFFDEENVAKILSKFGSFDVITANNVFAHTRKLVQFTANMKKLLKNNGIISIEVQYLPKLINNSYIDMIYHEHTSYHHFKPLQNLFFKHDLKLNSISEINTHGGSMRIILNKISENISKVYSTSKSKDFIYYDDKFDKDIEKEFKCLKEKVLRLKTSINEKLNKILNSQTILYGYSAPAKTVTLLSLLDENIIKKISFIIEDNKIKQGNYLPGTKIPLISSYQACKRINGQQSVCIIFAWNMFKELSGKIMTNSKLNPNALFSPLPFPKIIEIDYKKDR